MGGPTNFLQAALCGSGMLASTLLISPGPKPVTVLLCLGRVNCGPTGPLKSDSGALVEGRRSRGCVAFAVVAILSMSIATKRELLRERRWARGEGGVVGRIASGGTQARRKKVQSNCSSLFS